MVMRENSKHHKRKTKRRRRRERHPDVHGLRPLRKRRVRATGQEKPRPNALPKRDNEKAAGKAKRNLKGKEPCQSTPSPPTHSYKRTIPELAKNGELLEDNRSEKITVDYYSDYPAGKTTPSIIR